MPPLKWHGGKHYLARRIVERMPPHLNYVEPYFGGGAVLFAKDPEGVSEVANDLDGELTNFWQVLQDEDTFRAFRRQVEATPFSEVEWKEAGNERADGGEEGNGGERPEVVGRAVRFFVRCRMSLAGRGKGFTGVTKTRTRRGMNNEVSAWLSAVGELPAVHARLRRVLILCRPALEVLEQFDGPDTVFYLDPPYLPTTRTGGANNYRHEMTLADHRALLRAVKQCRGKVFLSGYPSVLYSVELRGWRCERFDLPNHAAGGEAKRRMTECLWSNC